MSAYDLPERLEAMADETDAEVGRLLREAAADLRRLRYAIVGHRGSRDWVGGKDDCDFRLWTHVEDVPWGAPIKGDG